MRVHRRNESDLSRSGSAMVLAIIVVGTVSALSAGSLLLSASVTNRQDADIENLSAFYLAEAGLSEAYHGLRIGLTGQVGSQAAPAAFGEGLLWVDATPLEDDRVQLESTALSGGGRATLSLLVERVETPLGFFSDEDLIVDDVLLVDGFDSEDAPYADQVEGGVITTDASYPYLNVDEQNQLVFYEGAFYRTTGIKKDNGDGRVEYFFDHAVTVQALSETEFYGPSSEYDIDFDDFVDDDWEDDFQGPEYKGVLTYFMGLLDPQVAVQGAPVMGGGYGAVHTSGGGLLGSNGSISFQNAAGEPVEVYGDVIPGADASVEGSALITGDTEPRDEPVELPEVELPAVDFQLAVQHAGAIPMIISPSTVGYERIDVAADAELIIRGPSTVVIGALTLAPGAGLTLDTENGDVSLFITTALDFEPGSVVTTSEVPQDLNIQVAAIPTVGGEAPVRLGARSRFHGAIYAPDTEVEIGADFEVFGGIVARRLDLAAGARLHFDNAGFDALPKLVSWRIVEIPSGVRTLLGNPFVQLGVDRGDLAQLAESHDLDGITLNVTYVDKSGAELSYSGPEALFEWESVTRVIDSSRSGGAYEGIDEGDQGENETGPTEPISAEDQALIDMLNDPKNSSGKIKSDLLNASPLSVPVLASAFHADNKMDTNGFKQVLLANSPLPPEILAMVIADDPSVLVATDRQTVLASQ